MVSRGKTQFCKASKCNFFTRTHKTLSAFPRDPKNVLRPNFLTKTLQSSQALKCISTAAEKTFDIFVGTPNFFPWPPFTLDYCAVLPASLWGAPCPELEALESCTMLRSSTSLKSLSTSLFRASVKTFKAKGLSSRR
jgi:hypothetical protein